MLAGRDPSTGRRHDARALDNGFLAVFTPALAGALALCLACFPLACAPGPTTTAAPATGREDAKPAPEAPRTGGGDAAASTPAPPGTPPSTDAGSPATNPPTPGVDAQPVPAPDATTDATTAADLPGLRPEVAGPPAGPFPLATVLAAKPEIYAASAARVEGPSFSGGQVFFAADGLGLLRADAQGKVFRYHPMLDPVGSFALGDGSLLVCEKKYVLVQVFRDGKVGVLLDAGAAGFSNDITVDGDGNIYFSDSHAGNILRLTPGGALSKVATGRKYPNGVEVDRASGFLYFSDTAVNTLFRIPLGPGGAGAVESLGPMIADGMAFDVWGNLWLAQVTLGQAFVYDPAQRKVIARVPAGGPQSTNLTFGGPGNDALFTTVAGKGVMRVPVGVGGFAHPGAPKYTVKAMLDLVPVDTALNAGP